MHILGWNFIKSQVSSRLFLFVRNFFFVYFLLFSILLRFLLSNNFEFFIRLVARCYSFYFHTASRCHVSSSFFCIFGRNSTVRKIDRRWMLSEWKQKRILTNIFQHANVASCKTSTTLYILKMQCRVSANSRAQVKLIKKRLKWLSKNSHLHHACIFSCWSLNVYHIIWSSLANSQHFFFRSIAWQTMQNRMSKYCMFPISLSFPQTLLISPAKRNEEMKYEIVTKYFQKKSLKSFKDFDFVSLSIDQQHNLHKRGLVSLVKLSAARLTLFSHLKLLNIYFSACKMHLSWPISPHFIHPCLILRFENETCRVWKLFEESERKMGNENNF